MTANISREREGGFVCIDFYQVTTIYSPIKVKVCMYIKYIYMYLQPCTK